MRALWWTGGKILGVAVKNLGAETAQKRSFYRVFLRFSRVDSTLRMVDSPTCHAVDIPLYGIDKCENSITRVSDL